MSRERIAAGDKRALAAAFTAYRPLAYKVLSERGRNRSDFDDLVQDAFLLLPDCARHCSSGTSLAGCVVTAVLQACMGFDARSATSDQTGAGRGMASRRVHLKAGEFEAFHDAAELPDVALELRQRVHHLSELLLSMPPRQRQILIAREIDDLGPAAVAELLGVSPASVSTLTGRARRELEHRAATSPLADVFAAMPARGTGHGQSRSSRWRRRVGKTSRSLRATCAGQTPEVP